ncbi:helix-turn-helix domain-containing protein [Nonomuraea longicatena]|uniref:TetR family transcriptional regulator n=1 Tax=Nonomuraea longicatena TaxID=83682 RepID=A0ABP4BL68_9ACTN
MRDDTRSRIQDIAFRLFTEQGYEATSLREIAEELGVTKAALYYHFRTKEDIVTGMVDDRLEELEEMLAWLRTQPKSPQTRRELIHRYAESLDSPRQSRMARFLERNQTALRDHPKILAMRSKMLEIVEELLAPEDELTTRVRRSMALFTLHAGMYISSDAVPDEKSRRAATVEVALELVDP